ncbi:hypothetical protein ACFWOG_04295 [Kitasatospora sp. NPDC058406]|uniref:hypothetical protein n=1 Tax=Kitasatospora sp. NPDC058406 TaxID=3346483 RepID=UPI003664C661
MAVNLAEIRGELNTGLANINGTLRLLQQSDRHTGQTLAEHGATLTDHERRIVDAERARAAAEEVRQSDRRRVQVMAAVVGIASGILTALVTALAIIRP